MFIGRGIVLQRVTVDYALNKPDDTQDHKNQKYCVGPVLEIPALKKFFKYFFNVFYNFFHFFNHPPYHLFHSRRFTVMKRKKKIIAI